MKMIKTTREFPFLFTVVALFVVAIVHLGIQIWGSPDQRSSLNALEAPVKAPKISSPSIDPDPAPAEPETPPPGDETGPAPEMLGENQEEPAAEPDQASPTPAPAPAPAAPAPAANVELKAPVHVAKPAEPAKPVPAKPAVPAKSTANPEKPVVKPAETSEVKVVKAEPLKPAKKTAKKKKKPSTDEPERPEYVIPEEWNWFSKPLTMKNIGSGWVMTAEETVDSSVQAAAKAQTEAVDKESEITAESAAIEDAEPEAKQPEKSEEKASETIAQKAESVVPQNLVKSVQEVPAPVSSQLAPFERALAKMAARKSKRNAEAARLSVTLPSGGGESRKVPGSLLKMIDTLGQMAGSTQGQLHNAADKASHVNESLRDATPAADEGVAPAEKDATSGPVAR